LVAVLLDTRATLIDEIIDLHDRFISSLFSKAKRKHADRFQESGKAIIRAPPVCGSRGRTRRLEGPKPGRLSLPADFGEIGHS